MSKFTVAGVSGQNGVVKVRFANDIVSRTKLLAKGGHSPLELVELPKPMSKADACQYLLDSGKFKAFKDLITETMAKKNGTAPVKAPKAAAPVKTVKSKTVKVVAPTVQEDDLEITEFKELAA